MQKNMLFNSHFSLTSSTRVRGLPVWVVLFINATKTQKNVDARNVAAGMSNHKNQQALTLKLKHSDGQVGLKSTEFLIAHQVTADVGRGGREREIT
jgi:hypothetical protein